MSKSGPKLLLVGAGLIGRRHLEYLPSHAILCGIVDPSPAATEIAVQFGVQCFTDLDRALNEARPDGAILATPNALHMPQASQCIAAGVPCLIEKPLAESAAAAAPVLDQASAADVAILVGHHRRHNNLIKTAKAAIDRGHLGELVSVDAKFLLYKPDDYYDIQWRRKPGAGPTFINMIHDLDLLRHLCGEVSAVMAVESHARRGFEVEDTAAVLLKFTNGALGTVSISDTAVSPWSWEFASAENPAYPHVPGTAYALSGTDAALSVPDLKTWHHPYAKGWWESMAQSQLEFEPNDPLDEQLRHFAAVIEGREEPLVSGEEGLRSLQLLEAIKSSATTQSWVEL